MPGGAGLLLLVPGIALILFALAILMWPELLAYLVATMLLFAGVTLTLWGWSAYRAGRRRTGDNTTTTYRVIS
jgi:membrane protein implicated in regulation of membrane protease activity